MTKKELSQYYWLTKEIEDFERRLACLQEKIMSPHSQILTGMPKGGAEKDRIGAYIAEIESLKSLIAAKHRECICKRERIEKFIYSIDDPMIRMIFTLRCIDGDSWREVAARMGYKMSEENARQIFYRYLKNEEKNNNDYK